MPIPSGEARPVRQRITARVAADHGPCNRRHGEGVLVVFVSGDTERQRPVGEEAGGGRGKARTLAVVRSTFIYQFFTSSVHKYVDQKTIHAEVSVMPVVCSFGMASSFNTMPLRRGY